MEGMELALFIVIGVLLLLLLVLGIKLWLLRLSLKEIRQELRRKAAGDTNTLLSVSSRDRAVLELAEELNAALRLLRRERWRYYQGDREVKEAITGLSHDLRTPLTALKGYLELLERTEEGPERERYLRLARNRAEALTGLTEELLSYSAAVTAPVLSRERVDVVRVLEESLLGFYGPMKARGIEPVLSLPEEPVYRELDKGALSRVFENVIGNALKYSAGDFRAAMEKDGTLTISNTAKGLSPVDVERFFDRFYTVETGRPLAGLGLAVARALMEQMGGRIGAEYRGGRVFLHLSFPEQAPGTV